MSDPHENRVVAVRSHEATVFVGGVRVRWRVHERVLFPLRRWMCDEHGESGVPTCDHAAVAAAQIAQRLLGLPAEVTTPATTTKENDREL